MRRKTLVLLGLLVLVFISLGVGIYLFRPKQGLIQHDVIDRSRSVPELKEKPKPANVVFNSCPAEGERGDPLLNALKNRVDEAPLYYPVTFEAILNLSWSKGAENRHRGRWSKEDTAAIIKHEGTPVAVEGYLLGAKTMEPETTNCSKKELEMRDFHVWLVAGPEEEKSKSIVTEVTPMIRAKHSEWNIRNLNQIAKNKKKVRISGWLMFDQEHPEDIGKSRGTIWEIHPIMKIEVLQEGKWVVLL